MNAKIKQERASAKVVILIIILLLLVLAGVSAFVLTQTDLINVNFSTKSKFTSAFIDVGKTISKNSTELKATEFSKNMSGKPVEYSLNVSGTINDLQIPGTTSTEVKKIKDIVNGNNVKLNLKADTKKDKFFGEAFLKDEKLGEVVYTGEAMALKIPELDEKYMAIFKDTLPGTKYESLKEVFDAIDALEINSLNIEDIKFTTEEKKHFRDVYANIFDDYVTDDMLEKEKTDITIDGNNKSCDKITMKLNGKQVAELLRKYIKAFDGDTKGRDILIDKYMKIAKSSGSFDVTLDQLGYTEKEFKKELENGFKDVVEAMNDLADEIEYNDEITYKFIAYADMFKTYRTELIMQDDSDEIKLTMNIKDDGLYAECVVESNGKENVLNLDITKSGINFSAETYDHTRIEFNAKLEDTKTSLAVKAKISGKEILSLNITSNQAGSTDSVMQTNSTIDLYLDYEDVKVSADVKLDETCKIVNSIEIPDVAKTNSTDVVKTGALDTLVTAIQSLMLGNTSTFSGFSNDYTLPNSYDDYTLPTTSPTPTTTPSIFGTSTTTEEPDIEDYISNALAYIEMEALIASTTPTDSWYVNGGEGDLKFGKEIATSGVLSTGNIKGYKRESSNVQYAGTVKKSSDNSVIEWISENGAITLKKDMTSAQKDTYKNLTGTTIY